MMHYAVKEELHIQLASRNQYSGSHLISYKQCKHFLVTLGGLFLYPGEAVYVGMVLDLNSL